MQKSHPSPGDLRADQETQLHIAETDYSCFVNQFTSRGNFVKPFTCHTLAFAFKANYCYFPYRSGVYIRLKQH